MGRPKLNRTEEERREARRQTLAKYEASPKGQVTRYKANHGPKADARYARYRETAKYAAAQERYHTSERWRKIAIDASKRTRAMYPERYAAHSVVASAVRSGRLVRPPACSGCGKTGRVDAHHHAGYVGHELDVTWLCRKCHKAVAH